MLEFCLTLMLYASEMLCSQETCPRKNIIVVEMKMVRWICVYFRKDQIRDKDIHSNWR
uniref:Uncharacterized protein n=1 Tax=Rhizophora mucronata TaxID=61149 RepID=A0A2P2N900_RHIMU